MGPGCRGLGLQLEQRDILTVLPWGGEKGGLGPWSMGFPWPGAPQDPSEQAGAA